MNTEPAVHRRRSLRLTGYDYSLAGAYFVTVCTQGRESLFAEIADGEMRENDAGRMAQAAWHEIPAHYPGIEIDAFVVMPNHVHGILIIGQGPAGSLALPDLMCRYKTLTTKRYADGVRHRGWRPFPGRLWQRNYWDRIIRHEGELQGIREYIQSNPARWQQDAMNT